MSIKTVGQELRQLRERRGFSQRELGRLTGISQGQICKLECDRAHPGEREWLLLREHLGLPHAGPPERQELPYPSTAFHAPRPQASGGGEVSFEARYYRARKVFGILAEACLRKIRAREDAALGLPFLNEARLDSAYEAMFWMLLLAEGGKLVPTVQSSDHHFFGSFQTGSSSGQSAALLIITPSSRSHAKLSARNKARAHLRAGCCPQRDSRLCWNRFLPQERITPDLMDLRR